MCNNISWDPDIGRVDLPASLGATIAITVRVSHIVVADTYGRSPLGLGTFDGHPLRAELDPCIMPGCHHFNYYSRKSARI